MKARDPEEMKHWPKEMVTEYDSMKNQVDLNNINTNYNVGETSWTPTLLQRFIGAVTLEYDAKFIFKGKIVFEMKIAENGPVLEIVIRTNDYGSMSTELPIEKIKSKACPKDFPYQLIKNFTERFKKKSIK